MLTLEAIAVLGTIYLFFMYATIRATRAAEREKVERKVRRPSATRKVPAISTRRSSEQPRSA
jgi:threonine/homoserine/homoserine lactone efflux protein